MKTVEQAAKEFADIHWGENYITENKTHDENAFKAGVEFAQRWISVDELPKIKDTYLVKIIIGTKRKKQLTITDEFNPSIEKFTLCNACGYTVINWRPIELK